MKANDAPVTRQELIDIIDERIEEIVCRVVGEIVGDALQHISERFDKIEARLDRMTDTVDHHAIDIRALKRKIA